MEYINLISLKLNNFKNIKEGEVSFAKNNKSFFNKNGDLVYDENNEITNIIGLYGQNGSGKTAVIEAVDLLKKVMSCGKLGKDEPYCNYINVNAKQAELLFVFLVEREDKKYIFSYSIVLEKKSKRNAALELSLEKKAEKNKDSANDFYYAAIVSEKINFKLLEKGEKETILFEHKLGDDRIESCLKLNDELGNMDFKKISILAEEYNCSVIFNIELMDILFEKTYRVGIHNDKLLFFGDAIRRFYIFATLKLFAITKRRQGFINAAKTEVLPFMMNDSSVIELNLTNSTDMTEGQFVSLKIVVSNQINPVLKNIIPDLTLRVKDLNGDKFDEKMNTIKKIEIIAVKNNVEIPLKYESDGTKKIIGLLCAVIAAANMPDVFLAVDEFDAGVFEFLLGEFLSILQEQMKGRLIFTSHNLIILERLDANSIRFSTVDENKKFVPFVGVKSTHNLRNVYLRNLKLGNDNKNKTDFYNETDKYEISRAIGKAGEEIAYG